MRKLHNQEGYCHCISFCVCYLIIIVTTWSGAATKRRRYRWTSQTVSRSDELLLLVLNIFHDTIPTNILCQSTCITSDLYRSNSYFHTAAYLRNTSFTHKCPCEVCVLSNRHTTNLHLLRTDSRHPE